MHRHSPASGRQCQRYFAAQPQGSAGHKDNGSGQGRCHWVAQEGV